jgi:hypothetical protein
MQIGFLNRTPRGRMATRLAYEHLRLKYKGVDGQLLFPVPGDGQDYR